MEHLGSRRFRGIAALVHLVSTWGVCGQRYRLRRRGHWLHDLRYSKLHFVVVEDFDQRIFLRDVTLRHGGHHPGRRSHE